MYRYKVEFEDYYGKDEAITLLHHERFSRDEFQAVMDNVNESKAKIKNMNYDMDTEQTIMDYGIVDEKAKEYRIKRKAEKIGEMKWDVQNENFYASHFKAIVKYIEQEYGFVEAEDESFVMSFYVGGSRID